MIESKALQVLMDKAEVATPGPWYVERHEDVDVDDWSRFSVIHAVGDTIVGQEGFFGDLHRDIRNAEFMAMADPTTVLHMALELSHLRKKVEELRKNDTRYRVLRDETQWLDEGPHVTHQPDRGHPPVILSEDELDEKLDALIERWKPPSVGT